MNLEDFAWEVEAMPCMKAIANLTREEWLAITDFVYLGAITNEKILKSAEKKVQNFESNLPTEADLR